MKIGIPRLVETFHGVEGMGLSARQHVIGEDPEFMMNLISSLDDELDDNGEPNAAEKSPFPLL